MGQLVVREEGVCNVRSSLDMVNTEDGGPLLVARREVILKLRNWRSFGRNDEVQAVHLTESLPKRSVHTFHVYLRGILGLGTYSICGITATQTQGKANQRN